MPIKSIRRLGDLLHHAIESIPPRFLVRDVARVDRRIYFRYFKGYRIEKISRQRILEVVRNEVINGENEIFANLVILAWNAINRDVYDAMRNHVQTINENVELVERIEDDQARAFLDDMRQHFAPEDIYICVYLNDVRMSPAVRREILPGRPIPEDSDPATEASEPTQATTEGIAELPSLLASVPEETPALVDMAASLSNSVPQTEP